MVAQLLGKEAALRTEARIVELLKSTRPPISIIKIAKTVGCGVSTVQRVLAAKS
jgi:hypothetical protein